MFSTWRRRLRLENCRIRISQKTISLPWTQFNEIKIKLFRDPELIKYEGKLKKAATEELPKRISGAEKKKVLIVRAKEKETWNETEQKFIEYVEFVSKVRGIYFEKKKAEHEANAAASGEGNENSTEDKLETAAETEAMKTAEESTTATEPTAAMETDVIPESEKSDEQKLEEEISATEIWIKKRNLKLYLKWIRNKN
jgi:hypothetical protein